MYDSRMHQHRQIMGPTVRNVLARRKPFRGVKIKNKHNQIERTTWIAVKPIPTLATFLNKRFRVQLLALFNKGYSRAIHRLKFSELSRRSIIESVTKTEPGTEKRWQARHHTEGIERATIIKARRVYCTVRKSRHFFFFFEIHF